LDVTKPVLVVLLVEKCDGWVDGLFEFAATTHSPCHIRQLLFPEYRYHTLHSREKVRYTNLPHIRRTFGYSDLCRIKDGLYLHLSRFHTEAENTSVDI
jgi:hypothetical protein